MTYDYIFYTDGGCDNNQTKIGGWAFARADKDLEDKGELDFVAFGTGYQVDTTSNRMELIAAIEALKSTDPRATVIIYSDSQYVIKGITEWIVNWKKNGWRNSAKKPVVNKDLWLEFDELCTQRQVYLRKVKGHSGVMGNELVDTLIAAAVVKKAPLDHTECVDVFNRMKEV